MNDRELELKILGLQRSIKSWASKKRMWTDSSFSSYREYFDVEPSEVTPTVAVLCTEGGLFNMFNGYSYGDELEEFSELLDSMGFYYEMHKPYVIEFFPANDELNQAYLDYFQWQWVSELIKPDCTDLYQEVFEYFDQNPNKLYSLTPRGYEILISEIFRNQGFHTVLGSGQNDAGVDIRVYRKDDIDQIPILVQAKKWKKSTPIKLEAVAALTGCVYTERADQGIFVTTSRFLPVAQRFAARENSKITLADSSDVRQWCKTAGNMIVRDWSLLTSDGHLLELLKKPSAGLAGKVVVAKWGHDCTYNDFCIIIKDTTHAALLMKISSIKEYSDAPYNMIGTEVPLLTDDILKYRANENFYRARKIIDKNGEISFYTKSLHFSMWDGRPQNFNHID